MFQFVTDFKEQGKIFAVHLYLSGGKKNYINE